MHTDLQKYPHGHRECPHTFSSCSNFPDLGHDLKPFLLSKRQVHIVKSCYLTTRALLSSNVPGIFHSQNRVGFT